MNNSKGSIKNLYRESTRKNGNAKKIIDEEHSSEYCSHVIDKYCEQIFYHQFKHV